MRAGTVTLGAELLSGIASDSSSRIATSARGLCQLLKVLEQAGNTILCAGIGLWDHRAVGDIAE